MQKRATVKDIAKHAGVSRATVSLVLRNSPLVARPTRERVQSSIASLGYVYDRAAANLRARHTHTIGLIVCEITNPFYAELTAGIDEALDRAGWVAFLANTAESPARQDRFIERMREHRVDGLLLSPAEGTDPEIIERLHGFGLPVVQMLRRLGRGARRSCRRRFPPRHDAGGRASHPARPSPHRLRRRRTARLAGARPRPRLSRDARRATACPSDRSSIACRPARKGETRGRAACSRGAARTIRRAILCHNDVCAFGVLVGLADRGLVAGKRLRRDRLRQYPGGGALPPGPDHRRDRRAPDRRGGGRACSCAASRRRRAPPESIVLPPRLIIRSSCGGQAAQEDQSIHPASQKTSRPRDQARRKANDVEYEK